MCESGPKLNDASDSIVGVHYSIIVDYEIDTKYKGKQCLCYSDAFECEPLN